MAASKSPRARLLHICDEIEGVAAIAAELSFEEYQASYIHRRAIERAAQIVSEAAKALPNDLLARHSDAPWSSIIGIGNILRHEYQRLDDKQLWEIATVHLPALEPIVRRMLAELED
ncbi:HepT-like ribonuclease domain-containing protein [Bradyrhizobium sp. 31Argb]|uniref:HepT-like ribonuclease domain-containing protein n=1 Tax=Bradyrhizobium sp. 31Argb TaxID=3141247 RepID=UPI003749E5A7